MRAYRHCLLAFAMLSYASLFCGTTGKISGKVVDAGTSDPIVGASVAIQGTALGGAVDKEGAYAIINVPPGTYQIRVSAVGYTAASIKNVRVVVDQTTTINQQLQQSAVELGDIIVQAERPMIQRDVTATLSVVSSEQIQQLPVKDFVEVLQLQTGVVGEGTSLHVRGGRDNEVAYLIDGMYVKDPVLGALGTRINNDAIQELVFLSGTFNAEYGNALSGVVNIVTKEGGRNFAASIEARTSEFGVAPFKGYRENRVGGTFSGPLFGDDYSFFVSGERDARGNWLPWGYDRTLSGIAKISARVLPELKGVFTGRYSENQHKGYSHAWKYIPDQSTRRREYSRQATAAITHSVLPNLFYDLRFTYFSQSYYSGIDKDTSQYVTVSQRLWLPTAGTGREFYALADPRGMTINRTETYNLKTDMVWQLGKANELKFGIDLKKHVLDYFDVYDPNTTQMYLTAFVKRPLEGAAYIQDKIELKALVVNIGLRFDYANQLTQFRSSPLDATSEVEVKPKTQISPRLGVAHPISDRTSLHFSYGRFFQNPDYSRLFENSNYNFRVREPLFGQPDLDAERTTSYEVGISQQFSSTVAGSFTAYYKDVTGNIGTKYYPPFVEGRAVGYTLYVNKAYSNIKGFEVSLNMRRTNHLAGSINYTYAVAKGNASSETEDYPGTNESTLLYPLSFDKTHLFNINVSLSWGENEGPALFGGTPLEGVTMNTILRASTGYPYTPVLNRITQEKNSGRLPATYSLDLEVSKEWKIGQARVAVFAEVLNLTDHKNVVSVYSDTGEPDATLSQSNSEEYIKDPSNYGAPRRMRLGIRFRL